MKIKYSASPIGSVATLAHVLSVDEKLLRYIAAHPADHYSVRKIPKKSGGDRTISDPAKELKIIQRRIVRRILGNCKFPPYLFGSVKDDDNPRDFVRNAEYHIDAAEVIAFDIDSFFPSVQPKFIKAIFKYLFNFPEEVCHILVGVTTLNNGLPQGAPTSSYLANLVFYDCEHKLVKTLQAKGLKYTRLVDDISVSSVKHIDGPTRTFVFNRITGLLAEKKLKISKRKYKITNTALHGEKTIVTGLLVENKKVKLPKDKVKAIGGLVYTLKKHAEVDRTDPQYHSSFGKASGQVALYRRLDPSKSIGYRATLREIMPTYAPSKVKKISWLCRNFANYAKSHPHRVSEEGYARKFYRYKHKINIIRRTHRGLALKLAAQMDVHRPTRLLASYYE